jgi:hypothetical protein
MHYPFRHCLSRAAHEADAIFHGVDFQGRTVPAIRVRSPQPKDQKGDRKSNGEPSRGDTASKGKRGDLDDEIPF